jgi:hypothetical protein
LEDLRNGLDFDLSNRSANINFGNKLVGPGFGAKVRENKELSAAKLFLQYGSPKVYFKDMSPGGKVRLY